MKVEERRRRRRWCRAWAKGWEGLGELENGDGVEEGGEGEWRF